MSLRAEIWGFDGAVNAEVLAVDRGGKVNGDSSDAEKSEVADVVDDIRGVVYYPTHCVCGLGMGVDA